MKSPKARVFSRVLKRPRRRKFRRWGLGLGGTRGNGTSDTSAKTRQDPTIQPSVLLLTWLPNAQPLTGGTDPRVSWRAGVWPRRRQSILLASVQHYLYFLAELTTEHAQLGSIEMRCEPREPTCPKAKEEAVMVLLVSADCRCGRVDLPRHMPIRNEREDGDGAGNGVAEVRIDSLHGWHGG